MFKSDKLLKKKKKKFPSSAFLSVNDFNTWSTSFRSIFFLKWFIHTCKKERKKKGKKEREKTGGRVMSPDVSHKGLAV